MDDYHTGIDEFDPVLRDLAGLIVDLATDPVIGFLLVCAFVGWFATRKGPTMRNGPR
jgi:hypothetical protein